MRAFLAALVAAVLVWLPAHDVRAAIRLPGQKADARRTVLGLRAARIARHMLGVPYRYGGSSPAGFDCSGLVLFVYSRLGVHLPRVASAQFGIGRRVSRASLRPGDLVFFAGLSHVALYVGGGLVVDAPRPGRRVSLRPLSMDWFAATYVGARRVV